MIAREKDAIRMGIDFLIVFPASLFLIAILCDTVFRNINLSLIIGISATLILALMANKWLKPKTISEQKERLWEEEIHLIDKIETQEQAIVSLKQLGEKASSWDQNDIDSKLRHIEEMKKTIEEIHNELAKFDNVQA